MKILQRKWWAKAIAMILCILSTMAGFLSFGAMLFDAQYNEATIRNEVYREIAKNYSIAALDWVTSGMSEENVQEHFREEFDAQFQFAIVASSIEVNENQPQRIAAILNEQEDMKLLYGTTDAIRNANYVEIGRDDAGYQYSLDSLVGMLRSGYVYYPHYGSLEDEDQTAGYTYYYVFSYVEDGVTDSGSFAEAKYWIGVLGDFLNCAITIEVLSLIIAIATFAFLMWAAGHRGEDDELRLTLVDKVWVEVLSMAAFLLVVAFCSLFVWLFEYADMTIEGMIAVSIELVFGIGIVCLWYLMSIVARFKAKKFWRYTSVYWCYQTWLVLWRKCIGFLAGIGRWFKRKYNRYKVFYKEHFSLLGKTVIVLSVVTVLGLITFAMCCGGAGLMWFLLATLLLWGIVLATVLQMVRIQEGGKRIAQGDLSEPIDTDGLYWEFKEHAQNINKVSDGIALAVEKQMKSERFKTELITNVSHDIKTPLTSIINYVDLIKKEEIQDEKLAEYIEVLDRQSARLKKLIEDLMEASKASTGNLAVNFEKCDARVLLTQIVGEFEEKTAQNQLEMIIVSPLEPVNVLVDGRHIWRVFDNLLVNICKYAQPGTRVYISLEQMSDNAVIIFKNISKYQLNISGEELMERFVRGDSSRNTEGSGLGLNIAQSLTGLMKGSLEIVVDGDLFKVILKFPICK